MEEACAELLLVGSGGMVGGVAIEAQGSSTLVTSFSSRRAGKVGRLILLSDAGGWEGVLDMVCECDVFVELGVLVVVSTSLDREVMVTILVGSAFSIAIEVDDVSHEVGATLCVGLVSGCPCVVS